MKQNTPPPSPILRCIALGGLIVGTPLKILWAALDLITIVVLGSGLYLWLEKTARGHRASQKEANAHG